MKTISIPAGAIRDVQFAAPWQQEIFAELSKAFGRRPMESLRSAAERVVSEMHYPEDEPVLRAAKIVLDLERRRALVEPRERSRVAWDGLAQAKRELMEPTT